MPTLPGLQPDNGHSIWYACQSRQGGRLEHLGSGFRARFFSFAPYAENYEGNRIIVLLLDSQSSLEHFFRTPGQHSMHAILFLGGTASPACTHHLCMVITWILARRACCWRPACGGGATWHRGTETSVYKRLCLLCQWQCDSLLNVEAASLGGISCCVYAFTLESNHILHEEISSLPHWKQQVTHEDVWEREIDNSGPLYELDTSVLW